MKKENKLKPEVSSEEWHKMMYEVASSYIARNRSYGGILLAYKPNYKHINYFLRNFEKVEFIYNEAKKGSQEKSGLNYDNLDASMGLYREMHRKLAEIVAYSELEKKAKQKLAS